MAVTDKNIEHATIDSALARLLDCFACPALVVGSQGQLIHTNRAARNASAGLPLAEGRLRAANVHDQSKMDDLIRRLATPAFSDTPTGPLALRPPGGGPQLLLQGLTLPPAGPADEAASARILMLVVDPRADRRTSAQGALQALGLTPREARVAARLGAGASPKEIAKQDEVSLSTVRFHVRNIYSKLNVRRVGELSRMVQAVSLIALGVGVV